MSSYLLSMSPVDEIGGYVDDGSDDMTAGYLSFDIDEYYLPEADHALYTGQQAAADPPVAHSLQADDADSYKSGSKAASSEGLSYHDKINNHQYVGIVTNSKEYISLLLAVGMRLARFEVSS